MKTTRVDAAVFAVVVALVGVFVLIRYGQGDWLRTCEFSERAGCPASQQRFSLTLLISGASEIAAALALAGAAATGRGLRSVTRVALAGVAVGFVAIPATWVLMYLDHLGPASW